MRSNTVLVVDDDDDIREVLRDVLEVAGYGVREARSGLEALAELRRAPGVCVMLLDLMMPEVSGWDVRRRQLAEPELAGVPVIVLSGTTGVAEHAQQLAADDYIEKPFAATDLLTRVERFCEPCSDPTLRATRGTPGTRRVDP
jgi:two-component system, chemotaxis family, chemotaxis protein CheY